MFVKNEKDSTFGRVLLVAEDVFANGPTTLSEITRRLTMSRGAIWRALCSLRSNGWVRMRSGDNAYEMRPSIAHMVASAHTSFSGADDFAQFIQTLARFGKFGVEFGMFSSLGKFAIVETTFANGYNLKNRSMVNDEIAIAAQLSLDAPTLLRHLMKTIEHCSEDERRCIQSGQHSKKIHAARLVGLVWSTDLSAFAIPCTMGVSDMGAIRIEIKVISSKNKRLLVKVANILSMVDQRHIKFYESNLDLLNSMEEYRTVKSS